MSQESDGWEIIDETGMVVRRLGSRKPIRLDPDQRARYFRRIYGSRRKEPIFITWRNKAEGRVYRQPDGCYEITVIGPCIADIEEVITYLENTLGAKTLTANPAKTKASPLWKNLFYRIL